MIGLDIFDWVVCIIEGVSLIVKLSLIFIKIVYIRDVCIVIYVFGNLINNSLKNYNYIDLKLLCIRFVRLKWKKCYLD